MNSNINTKNITLAILALSMLFCSSALAKWAPAEGPLMTRWAKEVSPDNVHPEYPRPQMVREKWMNLNGLWDYAITPLETEAVENYQGKILVPFPVTSAMSGVMKMVEPDQRLWYRRTFEVPADWKGQNILLHFGAVDWDTTVYVNGKNVGNHKGGYDPFTFDVTGALKDHGSQEVILAVWDPTNQGGQPHGKQILNPGGICYTRVNGIWQTVWLEPVPRLSIKRLKITPDIDNSQLYIELDMHPADITGLIRIEATVYDQSKEIAHAAGSPSMKMTIPIKNPKLWSPDDPYLYDFKVKLNDDEVTSYFGMRKISLGKDKYGTNRMMLNNEPLFHYGPLDQGWWPDGLYLPPTDEALKYDLDVIKKIGCNMLRKHVKVEPDRLYYWCDKIGLMVWQDMPSGHNNTPELKIQFDLEQKRMIDYLYNHPSIVMWVPFNEGWGQHDTERITDWVKKYDPSRLVNNASGWTDMKVGDIFDIHAYPGPAAPATESARAVVLGEFGGLGYPVIGHTWRKKANWGYVNFKTPDELTAAYMNLMAKLKPLISAGLSSAIYTQTSDVEVEVNGWMTYDREVLKMNADKMLKAHKNLYNAQNAKVTTILPASKSEPQTWKYTADDPGQNWYAPAFDDSAWKQGPAGFGRGETRNASIGTEWNTPQIWISRDFEITNIPAGKLYLDIFFQEEADVYINGKHVKNFESRRVRGYELIKLDKAAKKLLKKGQNKIAITCRHKGSRRYIDAGLVIIK